MDTVTAERRSEVMRLVRSGQHVPRGRRSASDSLAWVSL